MIRLLSMTWPTSVVSAFQQNGIGSYLNALNDRAGLHAEIEPGCLADFETELGYRLGRESGRRNLQRVAAGIERGSDVQALVVR